MRSWSIIALLLSSAVVAASASAMAEGDAAGGKALLEANCARCHAIGAEGASQHEKAPPFREVVTRYPIEDLEETLAEGIMSGHPDMPEISFKPDEITAILAYLGQLKASGTPPTQKSAPDPEKPAQP